VPAAATEGAMSGEFRMRAKRPTRAPAADRAPSAGFKNYITPAGHRRLSEELARLWKVERPALVQTVAWAAANGDRSENGDYLYGKRKLRQIDSRLRRLSKILDSAEVVDNAGKRHDRVFFGATVTYQPASGDERTVTIVGVDELDAGGERISWRSPLATALLKAKVGDLVTLHTPRGPEELEVVAIRYDAVT
jgi:transcription elongation factor GreB